MSLVLGSVMLLMLLIELCPAILCHAAFKREEDDENLDVAWGGTELRSAASASSSRPLVRKLAQAASSHNCNTRERMNADGCMSSLDDDDDIIM
jgi:hypothetical protein